MDIFDFDIEQVKQITERANKLNLSKESKDRLKDFIDSSLLKSLYSKGYRVVYREEYVRPTEGKSWHLWWR